MPKSRTRTRTSTSRRPAKRSAGRRAGESAYGVLLVARTGLMGALALLLLVAGVWTSWNTAQYAMLPEGRERGTMTVSACADDRCTGPYTPDARGGTHPSKASIAQAAAPDEGERVEVALKPGTDRAVRTGLGGVLYAWVPFAGSLLLAALVVAGGVRMRRTAWGMGLVGALVLAGAFLTL